MVPFFEPGSGMLRQCSAPSDLLLDGWTRRVPAAGSFEPRHGGP
jgi:hypothetical protein